MSHAQWRTRGVRPPLLEAVHHAGEAVRLAALRARARRAPRRLAIRHEGALQPDVTNCLPMRGGFGSGCASAASPSAWRPHSVLHAQRQLDAAPRDSCLLAYSPCCERTSTVSAASRCDALRIVKQRVLTVLLCQTATAELRHRLGSRRHAAECIEHGISYLQMAPVPIRSAGSTPAAATTPNREPPLAGSIGVRSSATLFLAPVLGCNWLMVRNDDVRFNDVSEWHAIACSTRFANPRQNSNPAAHACSSDG